MLDGGHLRATLDPAEVWWLRHGGGNREEGVKAESPLGVCSGLGAGDAWQGRRR